MIFEGKILEVIDGHTVLIVDQLNDEFYCRIFGIKAPELKQKYGPEARSFLSNLVLGQGVVGYLVVSGDVDASTADTQMLDTQFYVESCEITIKEGVLDLAEAMVSAGLARWDENQAHYRTDLNRLQKKAKAARIGLWATEAVSE